MSEPFDELTVRRQRLATLNEAGVEAYPSRTGVSHTLREVRTRFAEFEADQQVLTVAGRVLAMRSHGGSSFFDLHDGTERLQMYCKQDDLGEQYASLELIDLGDFVEVVGRAFTTKRGEQSILASEAPRILSKALRPLPEKWHGLSDVEIRYRKRYLDLLANSEVRATAEKRSALVRHLRNFLDERQFVEVETPMLQTIPGGATARPFMTHLNALDIDLYLRVAPELYLKRLLVGGLPRVYEVARCFRNEGIDHSHNPEFTQVEIYQAYSDYQKLMQLMEELLVTIISKTTGTLTLKLGEHEVDFTPPFPRKDWLQTLQDAMGGDDLESMTDEQLREHLLAKEVPVAPQEGRGAMLDTAYKKYVRPFIVQPTFLIDHPVELSPLSKRHHKRLSRVERFQLVLGAGIELMNGFSELNDPIDQRARFEEQERLRAAGDDEAQRIDEDYLEAMEHGMPPAAGVGIGIDRLAAAITNNHSLKEVILFPTLRPKEQE